MSLLVKTEKAYIKRRKNVRYFFLRHKKERLEYIADRIADLRAQLKKALAERATVRAERYVPETYEAYLYKQQQTAKERGWDILFTEEIN